MALVFGLIEVEVEVKFESHKFYTLSDVTLEDFKIFDDEGGELPNTYLTDEEILENIEISGV